ncbi:response regulator transcription factor [Serratia odorifera]|jgi:two-component system, LuxR family, response regulator FixJ|uniref:Response regulator receiver domain protein n=2 Tax=Serratia odorifera TaxID=618 RepID=D4DXU0_SEROD|nr:response regulator [Serratia odorifera]EFE97622.1 response regulator receiver domain protein [Serratia odorifera DSM 4582]MBJ2067429.1 response regulator transcription factor [Serratia odorifera]PNK82502.1 DNA-binding response regulator [Serratia odorifera]RII73225.1 DNA-binding response regulator [Serratia odorifera]VDZ53883.1 Transcriptional regulatory protein fixJ [Serratia odorifera]
MEQRIYLIDDDQAIRSSLSLLLATVGWQTDAYGSAQLFQQAADDLSALAGCMLLDIRMPGKTGLTLLDEWRQQGLTIPVIIMTGHANIDLCRRAFKNGAFEFLTKPIDADLLFEAIGAAMEQQKTGHEQQKKRLLLQARLATLTARENAIFEIIMKGYSNKEIARQFSLSPRTVEAHRANIFAKLEVNSLPKLLNTYGEITLLKND